MRGIQIVFVILGLALLWTEGHTQEAIEVPGFGTLYLGETVDQTEADSSIKSIDQRPNLTPVEQADVLFRDAYRDIETGNLSQAVAKLDRAIALVPDNPLYYSERANAKLGLELREAASADLDRAIALDPKHPKSLSNRAWLRSMQGDISGAASDILAAAADPLNEEPVFRVAANLVDQYSLAGRPDEAVEFANLLLAEFPSEPNTLASRGLAFMILGRVEEARSDLDRAIELDSQHGRAYTHRSQLHYRSGNYLDAENDGARGVRFAPNYWPAHQVHGCALGANSKYEQAIERLNRATQTGSGSGSFQVYQCRALARGRLGNMEAAHDDLSRAFELGGQVVVAAMQEQFKDGGFYSGSVDGVDGPMTRRAFDACMKSAEC